MDSWNWRAVCSLSDLGMGISEEFPTAYRKMPIQQSSTLDIFNIKTFIKGKKLSFLKM